MATFPRPLKRHTPQRRSGCLPSPVGWDGGAGQGLHFAEHQRRPLCTQSSQTSVLKILKPLVRSYLRQGRPSCLVPPASSAATGSSRLVESERPFSSSKP